MSIIKKKAY